MDRSSEIEVFKTLNLSLIASAFGYEIVPKDSTRHSVMMRNGADKIAIGKKGQHFVFWSVHDDRCKGTAIDFAQTVIEPGCSLGRVRQILRPFLNVGYTADLQVAKAGHYASDIKPSQTDLLGVAARYSEFAPITEPHEYLCGERRIPFELLQSARLSGRVRHCPERGSVIFPHYGSPEDVYNRDRCLTGYEIKGPATNMFSKGGRKGIFMTAGFEDDRVLAFAESGLDALSYLSIRGADRRVRVGSLSGKMSPSQPALVKSAVERMGEGSIVTAAFDNDKAGDQLTEELHQIVTKVGRSDLEFKDDRPLKRGMDWNKVLMDQMATNQGLSLRSPSFGR